MQVTRDASFTLVFAARQTVTPSYWLVVFTSVTTGLNNYCVAANQATAGGAIRLDLTETGDAAATATSGEVKLSPPGNWLVAIYEQTSASNLDPANATRLAWSGMVNVLGEACEPEANSGTECPPGGGDGCGETLTITVTVNGVLESTTTGLDACDDQTVNIA